MLNVISVECMYYENIVLSKFQSFSWKEFTQSKKCVNRPLDVPEFLQVFMNLIPVVFLHTDKNNLA